MGIDFDRIAIDADYWDKVAPNGASHLINKSNFVKWVCGVEYFFKEGVSIVWRPSEAPWPLEEYKSHAFMTVVAKPTKPESSEWADGFPSFDEKCLALYSTANNTWHEARIVGRDSDMVIGRWLEGPKQGLLFEFVLQSSFKPIISQKQKDCDNIEEDLLGILPFCEYTDKQIEELAEILYSLGYRKPVAIK
jgi:hypothetical protein